MAPPRQSRQSLLGLALLVVLLASVLAAWLIVRSRQAPIARGESLLRGIRDRTLDAYWASETEISCFLTRDPAGKPVGYIVQARWKVDERYEGAVFAQIHDRLQAERWTVDPSARTGTYLADVDWKARGETSITLAGGKVTVWQPHSKRLTKDAPDNYIPEGLLWLVVTEVARTDKSAKFSSVYNDEAIQLGDVNFSAVTMTPLGDGKVRLRADLLAGRIDETYHVNSEGVIVRIENNADHSARDLVDIKQAAKLFPEMTELFPLLEGPPADTTQPVPMEMSPASVEL